MAYTAWNVVFGEQPTAAKWNQLGQNDAGFRDGTNIDDNAILTRHLNNGAVTSQKIDFTPSNVTFSSSGGYSVTGTVRTILGGRFIFGSLAVNGSFNTSEIAVGTITLPITPSQDMVYRGAADSTGSRIVTAWINSSGTITIQSPDTFTGNAWFTFFMALV